MRLFLLCLWAPAAFASVPNAEAWHRLVSILQYLEADFPMAVQSQDAFELSEQKAFMKEAMALGEKLGPEGAGFQATLRALESDVNQGRNAEGVQKACGELVRELTRVGALVRSPRNLPDLEQGARVFAQNCSSCHGALGDGNSELGKAMKPPPANFLDATVMGGLSPYKVFNTTSFGITGTAMPAFPQLTEEDRWSVAFWISSLRQPPCEKTPPSATLEELATLSDAELEAKFGADKMACLRRNLPKTDENASLEIARRQVEKARALAEKGDFEEARQATLDGYLNGLEPAEASLRARNKAWVLALEEAFFDVRAAAEAHQPDTSEKAGRLLALLENPSTGKAPVDFWAVFVAALLILVREGFEAMVVVGALLAVLKKMGATSQARLVHGGWISALLVGGLLFVLGRNLLQGAEREWLEGVVALAAVAMLVYAAVWLNSKTRTREFMGEIRGQMQSALGKGSALGLFAISFSAVFRESFETALFLQGLSTDSLTGTVWGSLAGLLLLSGLLLFIRQVGFRLPMKPLFTASTFVLLATAVVMLGKGLRALQEVGALPLWPLGAFRLEVLGVWADAWTLLPQLLLLGGLALWQRHTMKRA